MRNQALDVLLGGGAASRIRTSKVLLVGAGGIGCELLKELVIAGFGEIHLIDLDTIDLSNLNRQFLFAKRHVRQSKAKVAAEVASRFNPDVHIIPYIANIIKSPEFTHKWFRSFDLAFNALDTPEARRHVNKMCVAANVPLIDCGSAGFHGQVQMIMPGKSECFDCRTHETPKTFPVCTIRSTPSQPIHCVVWSKSFLFSLLFAPSDGSENSEDMEEDTSEDTKKELVKLSEEANELADLKSSLRDPEFMEMLVHKVYVTDIERLLMAKTLWTSGGPTPPKPLTLKPKDIEALDPSDLDDHKIWSPEQALAILKFSTAQLIKRIDNGESAIEFDKDDEDALNFVVAATLLRSLIFNIPQRSKFEIKQMAGNIIPAVATTNAIVSGLGVLEAMKVIAGNGFTKNLRSVSILRHTDTVLVGDRLHPPSEGCVVSNAARTTVHVSPEVSLEVLIEKILKLKLGYEEVSLITDKLIYDPDFEDQIHKTLKDLNLVDQYLTVVDEDDRRVNLQLYIEPQSESEEIFVDSCHVPLKPQVKRSRDDSEEVQNADQNGKSGTNNDDDDLEIL